MKNDKKHNRVPSSILACLKGWNCSHHPVLCCCYSVWAWLSISYHVSMLCYREILGNAALLTIVLRCTSNLRHKLRRKMMIVPIQIHMELIYICEHKQK